MNPEVEGFNRPLDKKGESRSVTVFEENGVTGGAAKDDVTDCAGIINRYRVHVFPRVGGAADDRQMPGCRSVGMPGIVAG